MVKKIQKHIEIVRTDLPGLSSLSQVSANAIQTVLEQHYSIVGITQLNSLADLERLVALRPDLVFSGIKYLTDAAEPTRRIWLSEYLEQHGINHTGSPKSAIQLELNKQLAKERVLNAGLKTAEYHLVAAGKLYNTDLRHISFPQFVKPSDLGGGQGITDSSVVRNQAELQAKIAELRQTYNAEIIVETYLSGNEYSVAVIRRMHSAELLVLPVEMVTVANKNGDHILTQTVKTNDEESAVEVTDVLTKQLVVSLARGVFEALGARDYGRIDMRLDADGIPHFLEANLIPSLISGYGSFPKSLLVNRGVTYELMILKIVGVALNRDYASVSESDYADSQALLPLAPR